MNKYLKLLRVRQWYKNIVIFLALFFTDNLLDPHMLYLTILGFISLCFTSSSYYILNDIKDAKKDRLHPEKKLRPIASREISVKTGVAISMILIFCAISLAYALSVNFLLFPLLLFHPELL